MNKFTLFRPIPKGDKKTIRAWVLYDWANSVYQLTISSAIFPIYYYAVTNNSSDSTVSFFGFNIINTVLYSWAIAISYLLVAMFSPLFSSIADYTGLRKRFMKVFTYMGSIACGLLFFFNKNSIELGIIAFIFATIGYGGSLVFYNSFLPVIAEAKDQDRISARGYSMGYLGGVVLLIFNLVFILFPGFFGITTENFSQETVDSLPARLSFLSVFIWWIGFAQITFLRLPRYTFGNREKGTNIILKGYQELRVVFNQVRSMNHLKIYLIAFFFMNMGVLTVMFMAATYGTKELKIKDDILIFTILIIQLVGMFGAWLFARISEKYGNIRSLIISLFLWILIIFYAYLIKDMTGFLIVGFCVGLVMGGTQAIARSTYSKMLPETKDHTSFFSFFDVMEKLATVGGLFSFGIIESFTHNMRISVLAIVLFFIIGLFFMIYLNYRYKDVVRNL